MSRYTLEPTVWLCPICGLVVDFSLDCPRCGPYSGKTLGDLEREHHEYSQGKAKVDPFALVEDS